MRDGNVWSINPLDLLLCCFSLPIRDGNTGFDAPFDRFPPVLVYGQETIPWTMFSMSYQRFPFVA